MEHICRIALQLVPRTNRKTSVSASQDRELMSFSHYPHPSIAQREVLRQFYLSTSSAEQVRVVRASTAQLDLDTRCDQYLELLLTAYETNPY